MSNDVDDALAKLGAGIAATMEAEKFFEKVGAAMPEDTVNRMKERVEKAIGAGGTVTLKDNDTHLVITGIKPLSGLEPLASRMPVVAAVGGLKRRGVITMSSRATRRT